jgi:selenocysteine-specific elongation factor
MVPVSARTGANLDQLKSELRQRSMKIEAKPIHRPFRLPIDRAFVMKGFGAVVTGTLASGKIVKDAEVEVFPQARRARVRGIEVHNQQSLEASAGQRTALNLVGIQAGDLARGMVLAEPNLFKTTDRLDCSLTLLPSARPLKNHARVHFHCWTAETIAEVALVGERELRPGAHAYAQLRLAQGGLFLPGDRFIIRQFSPLVTLGGGMVVDNLPLRHKRDTADLRSFLATLETGSPESRLELLAQQYGEISMLNVVARTGWTLAEVLKSASLLEAGKRLVILQTTPKILVHPKFFEHLAQNIVQELTAFHTAQPLTQGLSKEDLRGRVSGAEKSGQELAAVSTALFNSILSSLAVQGKLRVQGELAQLAGREVQLSSEEATAKAAISGAFEKAGLTVPSAREVLQGSKIDRARAEKLLQILLKEKVLVKIADDLIFHQDALLNLRQMLGRRKAQSDRLNVGVFKEITGLSRKYAIPLLEYLDRERVTRRQGDERIIL